MESHQDYEEQFYLEIVSAWKLIDKMTREEALRFVRELAEETPMEDDLKALEAAGPRVMKLYLGSVLRELMESRRFEQFARQADEHVKERAQLQDKMERLYENRINELASQVRSVKSWIPRFIEEHLE